MKNLAAFSFLPHSKSFATPLAMTDFSGTFRNNPQGSSYPNSGTGFKKFSRPFKKSPVPFIILAIVVFIIAIVGLTSVLRRSTTNVTPSNAQTNSTTAQQVNIAKPLATETLNKEFDFPLKDTTGRTVSKFQYEIQSAELDNQIIIKGEEATAVQGKAFLVLNLKITNNFDKSVQLSTRDYIRLIVNNDTTDKLAADIHNDPVDVEAISTKSTRLAFPINIPANNLKLEVGEIDGPKQTIQLNLQ